MDVATIAGIEGITILADTSWTQKGWSPAVRPATRRNAVAALVQAVHGSTHRYALSVWRGIAAGDAHTALAMAMALPVWAKPAAVRDTWNGADSPNRPLVVGAMVRAAQALARQTSIQAEVGALEALEAMEAERIAKGKSMPFPTPAPGKVTLAMLGMVAVDPAPVAVDPAPVKGKRNGKGKGKGA